MRDALELNSEFAAPATQLKVHWMIVSIETVEAGVPTTDT
jgi:hypothetical protein